MLSKKRKNFRLPNGAGSVYKLGGNRRRPYTAVIHLGYTDEGVAIRKYIGYWETYEEAMHGLEMYKEKPYDLGNKNITIERLYEILLERRKDRSPLTITNYNTAYNHLTGIHDTPIRNLKTYHLQQIIDSLNTKSQAKAQVKTVLNQLYKIAEEMDVVNKNYAQYLKVGETTISDMHEPFTVLEIRKLWEIAKTDKFAEIPLILIYTGMRPQELLSITKQNVCLDENYMRGGVKTKAGRNRIIPIHQTIKPIIERRMNESAEYLIEYKCKQYQYNTMRIRWKKFMDDNGLHHLPHDGRHTFITMAQNSQMDKVILKRIVGHADKDLTDKIYTHKEISQLVAAVNNL